MSDSYEVMIAGKDSTVVVAEGQSILDAALRANEWLPHSCTQGTCGTCKLQVVCGEVDHRDSPNYTLTEAERAEGLALGCRAVPRSNLTVRPLGAIDDSVPHYALKDYTGAVLVLETIANETRRLVVELDDDMQFNAGQYCEILVPNKGVSRQYSMANPPNETKRLEFHVKRTIGGVATDGWIFDSLTVGDRVDLRGPLGQFGLVNKQEECALLIGGGTGLAPLKSIVLHALSERLVPELFLYHGGRQPEDLYDVEFFRDLDSQHAHFHYRPAVSDGVWDGAVGMVTDVVLEDFSTCRGMSAFLCGPPAMVEAATKALKRRRMAPRLIFKEEFTIGGAAPAPVAVQE